MLVKPGDFLLLKRTGGNIEAIARVSSVDVLDAGRGDRLKDFIARWWTGRAEDTYLHSKPDARFGAAIRLTDVRRVNFPAARTPRNVRGAWVARFGVGNWRPYG